MIKQNIILITLLSVLCVNVYSQNSINQFDTNGLRHGLWRKNFYKTNQPRYEGVFEHGKEVGIFKFYKIVEGKSVLSATKTFNPDNAIADVKFFASSGKLISEGQMDGKKYIGEWRYYHKKTDSLMTKEFYNNQGNLHGDRFVYYDNGQLAQQEHYVNGKLEGISKWYAKNGTLIKVFNFENDELHGEAKYYNDKGELLAEGQYKRGKTVGKWNYYENGKLVKTETH